MASSSVFANCYRGAEHVLTCKTQFMQRVGSTPLKRCPEKKPQGHVCAGINLEVHNAEAFRVCRVCWDHTGESVRTNNSDRSIIRPEPSHNRRRIPRYVEDLPRAAGDN